VHAVVCVHARVCMRVCACVRVCVGVTILRPLLVCCCRFKQADADDVTVKKTTQRELKVIAAFGPLPSTLSPLVALPPTYTHAHRHM